MLLDLDTNNVIRQRSSSNRSDSEGWTDGSISRANLTAWDGDLVGLTACWSSINASIPIRLWYASDNETFEEYLWFAERDEWVRQPSWQGYNGAAGVGFHTGAGFNTYVGMVNTRNELKFFYQRTAGEDLSNWQESKFADTLLLGRPTLTRFIQHHIQFSTSIPDRLSLSLSNTPPTNRSPATAYEWKGLYGTAKIPA